MKKMQLFSLDNTKEIALVNLSANDMGDNGEMQSWRIKLGKKDEELTHQIITWNDLENNAVSLSWKEVPEEIGKRFKGVVDSMLEISQRRKEKLSKSFKVL